MKKFTGDFETSTWNENETYVWAWALCEIGNENNLRIGNTIDSFIEVCLLEDNPTIYFHNLRFDGEFLLYYLLTHNFKYVKDRKNIEDNTFTTLINEMGQFYSIEVYIKKTKKNVKKITFIDSLKIIPMPVREIPKNFNLEINKLEIDYNKYREKGHILTLEEKEYIKNDVVIVAKALNLLFSQNLTKMTIGSNALLDFKSTLTISRYKHLFPELDPIIDEDIRQSYKGGFTYLNPIYQEKEVVEVNNLDVNSLYSFCMAEKLLPFGEPIFFDEQYKEDKIYPLYIQMLQCKFELKSNHIPTIQLKNSSLFKPNEYVKSSKNKKLTLVLTSIDLQLFLKHYNIIGDITYKGGWKFKAQKGIFKDYIDKWIQVKIESTKNNKQGMRTLAKLMLNSLYGKFSTALTCRTKKPELTETNSICYILNDVESKKGLYIPMGCFITAYAREKTISTAQKITDYSLNKYGIDKFIYSDTDSLKTTLSLEELKNICEIHDTKLGAWKFEGIATKARFLRQKCYIMEIDNKIKITCAGLPQECYSQINFENFKIGFKCNGKLQPKHIKGGVILKETEFTIKDIQLKENIKQF